MNLMLLLAQVAPALADSVAGANPEENSEGMKKYVR